MGEQTEKSNCFFKHYKAILISTFLCCVLVIILLVLMAFLLCENCNCIKEKSTECCECVSDIDAKIQTSNELLSELNGVLIGFQKNEADLTALRLAIEKLNLNVELNDNREYSNSGNTESDDIVKALERIYNLLNAMRNDSITISVSKIKSGQ